MRSNPSLMIHAIRNVIDDLQSELAQLVVFHANNGEAYDKASSEMSHKLESALYSVLSAQSGVNLYNQVIQIKLENGE